MSDVQTDQAWRKADLDARQRVDALVAAMTFDEKVAVALRDFDSIAHLGVPSVGLTDGPNGIRGPENVTAFPAALALAASFNEELATA